MPTGTFRGCANAKRYVVTKSGFVDGAAQKIVAEELGGADYISLNLYRVSGGAQLRPCEMPADKVIAFVMALTPDPGA